MSTLLRQLPQVDALLATPGMAGLLSAYSRQEVADTLRSALQALRADLKAGHLKQLPDFESEAFARSLGDRIEAERQPNLRPAINATGIIVHTNLGRARLALSKTSKLLDLLAEAKGRESDAVKAGIPTVTGLASDIFAGVRLGGPVTLESLVAALYDGMRLATILICVGAANSLASPARLLKAVPAALYEFGLSVVIAVTFAPQLVADLDRIRTARRLRGRTVGGVRGTAAVALPVLEGALERSVTLAAAMDSRGYGRQADRSVVLRRLTGASLLAALVLIIIGTYALLDASAPASLGLPMLGVGLGLSVVGFALAGRRSARTRYRPDPWTWPEWGVSACAAITGATLVWLSVVGAVGLIAPVDPIAWPAVPALAVAGILVSVLPAYIAPPVPGRAP